MQIVSLHEISISIFIGDSLHEISIPVFWEKEKKKKLRHLHEISNLIYWEKYKKKKSISNFYYAEFAQRWIEVNTTLPWENAYMA